MLLHYRDFEFYFVIVMLDFRWKLDAIVFPADWFDLRLNIMLLFADLIKHPDDLSYVEELKESGYVSKIMLDSGAFLVLANMLYLSSYRKMIEREYLDFASEHADLFDYIIVPNIPCTHPVDTNGIPNEERIKMTVENTVRFLSEFSEREKTIVV